MELSLENVGEEYLRQDPFVRVILEPSDENPDYLVPHLTTNGVWPLEAVKLLYSGIYMLGEELSSEDREELDAWLAEDGD